MAGKKNFGNVMEQLGGMANDLPSQVPPAKRSAPQLAVVPPKSAPASRPALAEDRAQLSLDVRRSQRKQIEQLARDADMTTKAFILLALRDKGVRVTDEDLQDRRGRRP